MRFSAPYGKVNVFWFLFPFIKLHFWMLQVLPISNQAISSSLVVSRASVQGSFRLMSLLVSSCPLWSKVCEYLWSLLLNVWGFWEVCTFILLVWVLSHAFRINVCDVAAFEYAFDPGWFILTWVYTYLYSLLTLVNLCLCILSASLSNEVHLCNSYASHV